MVRGACYNPRVKRNALRAWPPVVLLMGLMLMSIFGITACSPPATVTSAQSTKPAQATNTPRATNGLPVVNIADLSSDAQRTIVVIQKGGPFSFERDGGVFQNREGLLPQKPRSYYREYAVVELGANDRGPRRIVAGESGELFYTEDRFASFVRVSTTPSAATLAPTSRPKTIGGIRMVGPSELPREAQQTIALIKRGGPFPFERDGVIFQNRELILPQRPRGYYREYTVITPGEDDRGARRIIAGQGGEMYYTADHYDSFVRVIQP